MGSRHFQPHTSAKRAPWFWSARVRLDNREQLLHALQDYFEVSRDQFDERDLAIPEWRQADDALERAYDACAAREALPAVTHLCAIARRAIDIAVEISRSRSYYDGRV